MKTFGLRCGSGARLVRRSPITSLAYRVYGLGLGIVARSLTSRIEPRCQGSSYGSFLRGTPTTASGELAGIDRSSPGVAGLPGPDRHDTPRFCPPHQLCPGDGLSVPE